MAHKSFIFVAVLLVVLLGGAVAVYAYDSSNEDRIADGITAAGVNVGGLTADQARAKLGRQVAAGVEKPVVVTHGKDRFTLSAADAGIHADIGGMVSSAVARSRQGNLISRSLRDVSGGEEDASIPARVTYSKRAARELATRVSKSVDRPAKDASVNFPSLSKVASHPGLKVDEKALSARVTKAMTDPDSRQVAAPTTRIEPNVTQDELAKKYPTVLIVDRGAFKLRLYKGLALKKEYPIAVGQVGLETPAGLYHIQNKGENVPWNVPDSDWAGDLAGTTVPGGSPDNPLKARWMGIFAGAGIHGTDEVNSLGSAASHGCVRMAIPDVIELYDQVPVHSPIYIQ